MKRSLAQAVVALVSALAGSGLLAGCAEPRELVTDCGLDLVELPLVTHWRNGGAGGPGGYEFLASDQIELINCQAFGVRLSPRDHFYCDDWTAAGDAQIFYPAHLSYRGENYSLVAYSDEEVRAGMDRVCRNSGAAVRLLRPDALDSGRVESGVGMLQILHGQVIHGAASQDSLANIILPPFWSADARPGTYPLIIVGGYDINTMGATVVEAFSPAIVEIGGAIGVFWNGGASANSASMDARMYDQFQDLVDFLSGRLGADRHRILMTGASRMGQIQLLLAGNPHPHDYTVVWINPSVPGYPRAPEWAAPGVSIGTYRSLIGIAGFVVGVPDAWRHDWTYPEVGNGLAGLSVMQAAAAVASGVWELDEWDQGFRPFGDEFVEALVGSGTRVLYEFSSHDSFQDNAAQIDYLEKLLSHQVPVEIHYTLQGGHAGFLADRVREALGAVVEGDLPALEPGWQYYRIDRLLGLPERFEPVSPRPFTLEHPQFVARGVDYPMVLTGRPGTLASIAIRHRQNGSLLQETTHTLPPDGTDFVLLDVPADAALGWYDVDTRIRDPGQAEFRPVVGTRRCQDCSSDLLVESAEGDWGCSTEVLRRAELAELHGPGPSSTGWGVADETEALGDGP